MTVYADERVAKRLMDVHGGYIRSLQTNIQKRIKGGYLVTSFDVPHEDIPNSAYLIQLPNKERILYATDFECIEYRLSKWNIDHYLIAINYSDEIPEDAVAREHRLRGHSSLDTVLKFLHNSLTENCKTVTICHLSSAYADPEKILHDVKELCSENIKVTIAKKGIVIDL